MMPNQRMLSHTSTLSANGAVTIWAARIGCLRDPTVKPRNPETSVRVALRDVRCPRRNRYGRPRIVTLAQHPSM